jgi:hypothetical protein
MELGGLQQMLRGRRVGRWSEHTNVVAHAKTPKTATPKGYLGLTANASAQSGKQEMAHR